MHSIRSISAVLLLPAFLLAAVIAGCTATAPTRPTTEDAAQTAASTVTPDPDQALRRLEAARAKVRGIQTGHPINTTSLADAQREHADARAGYIAALAAKYRSRLAFTRWKDADGNEQIARVWDSISALDDLLSQWSPLGDGGFSRSEVESILGQAGRDEPSETEGPLAAVTYRWDTGFTGTGIRIWYMPDSASSGGNRAMRVERLLGE